MKRLFLTSFVAASFVTQAMASDDEFTFECEHVRPSEVIRVLRGFTVFGVSIKEEDRKVIVTGGDPSLYKKMEVLMELVDAPPRVNAVRPRYIKLRFAEATRVAAAISEAFPAGEGNKEVPLQVVPNTRTNEVVLLGTVEDVQAAEALIRSLDQAQAPARR